MPNPEEYRRTRRIVDLILRIANQPRRWTRRRLAERYEVSEQQMDKDLALIRHGLVMPLHRSPEGYHFDRLTLLPSLTLSLPEALSLLLAARAGQQMHGTSHADLAAGIARLESLLPARLQPVVGGLVRAPERSGADHAPALRDLQLAIAERSRLRMVYRSASREGAPVERVVDPYALIPYQRSWYLVAHCHLRDEVRIFKLERIEGIAPTGEGFDYPGEFDLDGYMGATWGLLRGEAGEPEDVLLEFVPEVGRWIRDQELHPGQTVEEMPDGRVRLGFHVGITPEFRRWVLGFGRQVRVVRPAGLGEWVREEARGMGEGQD